MRRIARWLGYLGTVGIVIGLGLLHAQYVGHYSLLHSSRIWWSLLYIGFLWISFYGVGLPDEYKRIGSAFVASIGATVAATIGISVIQLLGGSAVLPRFVLFSSVALLILWYCLCALMSNNGDASLFDHAALIGSETEYKITGEDIQSHSEHSVNLVALIKYHDEIVTEDILKQLENQSIDVLVLDNEAQRDDEVIEASAQLHKAGLKIRTLGRFYEEWIGKSALSELERISLMFDIGEIHTPYYAKTKRLFDILLGAISCVFLIVVIPFVFLINTILNRGPLFFGQERVGRNDQTFTIWKFTTMRHNANDKSNWTESDDKRVTKFGHFMRITHLDELPQSWNILCGDISVIGPRPEQTEYVNQLKAEIPFYDVRHLVRPGLTGWAQVNRGYGANIEGAMDKLQFDIWYLRRQSLLLDLKILVRTIRSVTHMSGN